MVSCTRPSTERRDRTTAVAIAGTAQNGTSGVLANGWTALFLAAPIAFKGRLVQYARRILRTFPGRDTAEIHDYHDVATGVLASSLAKRAPGYTSLSFPDPRKFGRD